MINLKECAGNVVITSGGDTFNGGGAMNAFDGLDANHDGGRFPTPYNNTILSCVIDLGIISRSEWNAAQQTQTRVQRDPSTRTTKDWVRGLREDKPFTLAVTKQQGPRKGPRRSSPASVRPVNGVHIITLLGDVFTISAS